MGSCFLVLNFGEDYAFPNERGNSWPGHKSLVEFFLQVYDVTPFVEEHPGGDAILNNAGGDSTVGFFGYFLCTLNSRL